MTLNNLLILHKKKFKLCPTTVISRMSRWIRSKGLQLFIQEVTGLNLLTETVYFNRGFRDCLKFPSTAFKRRCI